MLALFCVTLAFTSCSDDDSSEDVSEKAEKYEKGTMNNPYNVAEAINAVKDMTWTSNTEYDKTDDVYVKGKISRIANRGTYAEGESSAMPVSSFPMMAARIMSSTASAFSISRKRNTRQVKPT